MLEINLDLDQDAYDKINLDLSIINDQYKNLSANDMAREALAVYKWAVEQLADGYAIVSMNKDRHIVSQVATYNLPPIAPTK